MLNIARLVRCSACLSEGFYRVPGFRNPKRSLSPVKGSPTSRVSAWAAAVAVATAVATAAGGDPSPGVATRQVWAMGTRLQVTIEATDRGTALGASEAALHAVAEVELRLSTWRDDSELALFNRAPFGTTIPLSRELAAELFEARHWWMESGGAFDPGIASLVRAWDLRGPGREPTAAELGAARATAGLDHLFLGMGVARRLVDNFGIEEGGFAKGIAVRLAADGVLCGRSHLRGDGFRRPGRDERRLRGEVGGDCRPRPP